MCFGGHSLHAFPFQSSVSNLNHKFRRYYNLFKKYSEGSECPDGGLIYAEWKATCSIALNALSGLLERKEANTSPELLQFIRGHDIHPALARDIHPALVGDFLADRSWKVHVRS